MEEKSQHTALLASLISFNTNAFFKKRVFGGIHLENIGETFTNCDFRTNAAPRAAYVCCKFKNCHMHNNLQEANMSASDFSNSTFIHTNVNEALFIGSTIDDETVTAELLKEKGASSVDKAIYTIEQLKEKVATFRPAIIISYVQTVKSALTNKNIPQEKRHLLNQSLKVLEAQLKIVEQQEPMHIKLNPIK